MKSIFNILILSGAVLLAGCSKKEVKQESPANNNNSTLSAAGTGEKDKNFKVQYASPRVVYKIEEADLDNNGKDEYIVFSVANDTLNKTAHQFYKFDMMEVFVKDSVSNSYRKISTDTVDFSDEYWIMNLEKDKSKQIIVKTNMGGNDVVNSRGMYVFNYEKDKVNLVKYFDTGNPEVKDVNSDGNKEILVSDSFFGILPESSAIYYTSEIFKYNDGKLNQCNKEFKKYFLDKASAALDEYNKVKDRVNKGEKIKSSEYLLYKKVAEIILAYSAAGENSTAAKFWSDDNAFLQKNLAEDEYQDLKKFISKLPPIASTI
ncbi:MAG: hypothetical protein JST55_05105 [Bacteroidetes bacterium]|nr:hypothetical protein [Bacteroidota bacterium]